MSFYIHIRKDACDLGFHTPWDTDIALNYFCVVGYGHITPKTQWGRLVTILYALIGIPFTLLTVSNLGSIMDTAFRIIYKNIICGICYLCCQKPDRGLQNLIYLHLVTDCFMGTNLFPWLERNLCETNFCNLCVIYNIIENHYAEPISLSGYMNWCWWYAIYFKEIFHSGSPQAHIGETQIIFSYKCINSTLRVPWTYWCKGKDSENIANKLSHFEFHHSHKHKQISKPQMKKVSFFSS